MGGYNIKKVYIKLIIFFDKLRRENKVSLLNIKNDTLKLFQKK